MGRWGEPGADETGLSALVSVANNYDGIARCGDVEAMLWVVGMRGLLARSPEKGRPKWFGRSSPYLPHLVPRAALATIVMRLRFLNLARVTFASSSSCGASEGTMLAMRARFFMRFVVLPSTCL